MLYIIIYNKLLYMPYMSVFGGGQLVDWQLLWTSTKDLKMRVGSPMARCRGCGVMRCTF